MSTRQRARVAWLNTVASSVLIPAKLRVRLYRLAGIPVGRDSGIMSDVYVGGDGLSIGAGCFVNRFVILDAGAPLTIEDNVFIAYGTTILTSSHEAGTSAQRAGWPTYAPVTIGHGSWIGANATILPGVTVAPGCVIAAGAVITQDTKPDTLYAGVPATLKRHLGGER